MKNQNYNPNPAAIVIMTFSVRDLRSGRNLPPAEEMNRILTHTPTGCIAYTPVGPFLVREATEAIADIMSANTTGPNSHLSTINSQLSTANSPCDICSLRAYHRFHDVCPLFPACAAHLRSADRTSVVFCRVTSDEEKRLSIEELRQENELRKEEKRRRCRISERKKLYLRKLIQRRRGRHRRHRRC